MVVFIQIKENYNLIMGNKTCFFIGNRHTPYNIKQQLVEIVEKHITEYGVTTFTVGHYGSFDSLVKEVLREAKKRYADIKLYLLTPYALDQKIETRRFRYRGFASPSLNFIAIRTSYHILKLIKNTHLVMSVFY